MSLSEKEIHEIVCKLRNLTSAQQNLIKSIVYSFEAPHYFNRAPDSDIITESVLESFGDRLMSYHVSSRQALSKDRFEFAFESALNTSGIMAQLAESRTNRGHDITILGTPVSLKTEAASNIKDDLIHISKWMELGRGEWELSRLLILFIEHMKNYDRIFTLRRLKNDGNNIRYELVEIPKSLLLEAANCELESRTESRQNPKPGYGYVRDAEGNLKYALYFDGGTERKLQIKHLKKNLCKVHATWIFKSSIAQ